MSKPRVRLASPQAAYHAHKDEIDQAIHSVLDSGWYVLGTQVKNFEQELADYLGVRFVATVATGTDAVSLALRAVGIGDGNEVVTTSHSAVATVAAICQVGATPVFADIDSRNRCIDVRCIEKVLSPRTKAIVPVHIYGHPAAVEAINVLAHKHGLVVVEDCAQAIGASVAGRRVGTFGNAAAFSFYPTKNLGAIGDGGAVATNDASVYQNLLSLRQYGWGERYVSETQGFNSRLDEIQAALLRVKLKYLDANNRRRQEIAGCYKEHICGEGVRAPRVISGAEPVYHLYVVEVEEREKFESFMDDRGIDTSRHYPYAIHQQPAYRNKIRGCEDLVATEKLYQHCVSLPIYPELPDDQIVRVSTALRDWCSGTRERKERKP